MRKLVFVSLLGLMLTSCSMFHVHKVEVDQGNYMTAYSVNRLHPGMSKEQVKEIMGEPVLINIMNPRVETYVYTSQIGTEDRIEKRVTLMFNGGRLEGIQREGI